MKPMILLRNAAAVTAMVFALGQAQFVTAEGAGFSVYSDNACATFYGTVGSYAGVEALHAAKLVYSFKFPNGSTCWKAT